MTIRIDDGTLPIFEISDEQIRQLRAYADCVGDARLAATCVMALSTSRGRRVSVELARERCTHALARATLTPEWVDRDLPRGTFEVAEKIAQFVLSEAAGWEHLPSVHDAMVELARKIRTADWIEVEREIGNDPCLSV